MPGVATSIKSLCHIAIHYLMIISVISSNSQNNDSERSEYAIERNLDLPCPYKVGASVGKGISSKTMPIKLPLKSKCKFEGSTIYSYVEGINYLMCMIVS